MEEIFKGHGVSYEVLAATIMPNHVHTVLQLSPDAKLADVVEQIKGASSRSANLALGRSGRLWQPSYFDRLIRNSDHRDRCIRHTHWNPMKARLCADPEHHATSTANDHWIRRLEG